MKTSTHGTKEREEERKRLEIIKAVAQAWLNHSNTSKTAISEFEARRRYSFIKDKPSRFKLEALSLIASTSNYLHPSSSRWDFGQSLWDSYEIVAVSKKLERGLALESSFSGVICDGFEDLSQLLGPKKKKNNRENRNSLRSLFYRACSRRYNNADVNIPEI